MHQRREKKKKKKASLFFLFFAALIAVAPSQCILFLVLLHPLLDLGHILLHVLHGVAVQHQDNLGLVALIGLLLHHLHDLALNILCDLLLIVSSRKQQQQKKVMR